MSSTSARKRRRRAASGRSRFAGRNARRGFADAALVEIGPIFSGDRPQDQRTAIGRLGYGAGVLGKIYLRFPRRFWPERPKWFGRLPDSPERRGTFNTWVSHEQETGLPILLSFSNGATAARSA